MVAARPALLAVAVPAVLFVASFVRSTFGFGEALISVPVLALIIPVRVAAPLAVLASITVAAMVVAQDWKHVHVFSAGRLVISSLLGIPVGLWLLKSGSDALAKAVLGVVILGFSLYSLRRGEAGELSDDRLAWVFGFAAGVLGGAYGMNGPPLVVYGALRRWSPVRFRATLQGYFLFASAVVMCGFWDVGLWTRDVSRFYAWSLPGVIVAVLLGRIANRRMESRRYYRFVFVGLALIGAGLLAEALRR